MSLYQIKLHMKYYIILNPLHSVVHVFNNVDQNEIKIHI